MLKTNKIRILDFNIDLNLDNLSFTQSNCVINTINPHSYYVSKTDSIFKEALLQSDILIPDGEGIVLAAKILKNRKIKKIAGYDLHEHILTKVNEIGGKVFYLGSTDTILKLIFNKISIEYPHIQVTGYSPPFKATFTKEDNAVMVSKINEYNPEVLFVGMTAPKQEKWVYLNRKKLNVNIIASIGAVFDFYSGKINRPNTFWIKMKLEWLIRFLREPKRLWRRNTISTSVFLLDVIKAKLKHD